MGILRTDWMEAAEVSAASRFQFWRYVGLPILVPFLAAGWVLIFTWSIGIYGLAFALVGGSGTSSIRLITLQIGFALNSAAGSPYRAAVHAVLLLLFATVSLTAYRLILRRALRWFT
jgi:putative spermidine/putrescine transport system permease protein